MRILALFALFASAFAIDLGFAGERNDTRAYWVYEGGWFAKSKDGSWYEMNEDVFRTQGKPWQFREAKRTKVHVELVDENRKVTVRLSDTVMEARFDSDGKDADFKIFYKGRWKKSPP